MNAKAERIEQIIQIANRNLLLIYSNQESALTTIPKGGKKNKPLLGATLNKDKFGYEMTNFVKSEQNKIDSKHTSNIADKWNNNFVQGLEALLFECATVKDEIERNCFISRTYVWFNEKLIERRDLPKTGITSEGFDNLRNSINNLDAVNSMKALDQYSKKRMGDNDNDNLDITTTDTDIYDKAPAIIRPYSASQSEGQNSSLPLYVRHAYPSIMKPRSAGFSLGRYGIAHRLGGDGGENFGLLHHVPETEAEKTMHALWLSRRRQEAFEWKSQQQLSLVMDRFALHKSRLESDALRRQESNQILETLKGSRSSSALNTSLPGTASTGAEYSTISSANGPRFVNPMRPISGNLRRHASPPRTRRERVMDEAMELEATMKMEAEAAAALAKREVEDIEVEVEEDDDDYPEDKFDDDKKKKDSNTLPVIMKKNDSIVSSEIQKIGKINVSKSSNPNFLPMRFKTAHSEAAFKRHTQFKKEQVEQNEYMTGYDSGDDVDVNKYGGNGTFNKASRAGGISASSGGSSHAIMKSATSSANLASRGGSSATSERRDRPKSAGAFRSIANNDPELMVYYRQSAFRRMPLGDEHHLWLDEREKARKVLEAKKKAEAEAAAAAAKDKGKGKDKGGGKDAKGKGKGKDAKVEPEPELEPEPKKPREFYIEEAKKFMKNYMSDKFGVWTEEGPGRTWQMLECDKISLALSAAASDKDKTPLIRLKDDQKSRDAVMKALVIPQDKPNAICQEQIRNPDVGLMENPLPKEFWRKLASGGGGGKKKKAKKKK